jgi:HrpA-like RNA helicase
MGWRDGMSMWYGLGLDISGITSTSSMLVLSQAKLSSNNADKYEIESILLEPLPNEEMCIELLKKQKDENEITQEDLARVQVKHIFQQIDLAIEEDQFPDLNIKDVKFVVDTVIHKHELLDEWDEEKSKNIMGSKYVNKNISKRDIDVYYDNSIETFASLMGSVIQRFRMMHLYAKKARGWTLGVDLFESYPRASLIELDKDHQGVSEDNLDSKEYKK